MKIAIFGGGSIGARHARNAVALWHQVEIFDTDSARGREPRRFLGADAVMICTPASTHEAVAEMLLEGGYCGPLFIEKPVALRSAAPYIKHWPHPVTMVGYNWRFHPDVIAAERFLGPGVTVQFVCDTDMRTWPGYGYADPWLECSHDLDLACAWFGPPKLVTGSSLSRTSFRIQALHTWATAWIDVNWQNDTPTRLARIQRADTQAYIWPSLKAGLDLSYVDELRHFLACVESGATPVCTFADGLRVVDVIERARRLAA